MANIENSEYYSLMDRVASKAVRGLSAIVGVKNIMLPFWNRWRASLIGEETISKFLGSINTINDWPDAVIKIIGEEQAKLQAIMASGTQGERITALRRLSYLCHMGQWGCLGLTVQKRYCYRLSRDYYIAAEQQAHGASYRRVGVPWKGATCWGNLHLPKSGSGPFPLVVIIHGMDDTKEEHLTTENALQERGYAVFCFDGPGQGEALFCDEIVWPEDFNDFTSAAIDVLCAQHDCDSQRVGVIGISWGGTWAIKLAASDKRIKGVLDLGGPINASTFMKIPFFLKSKSFQVLGPVASQHVENNTAFAIDSIDLLREVSCPVRIVHGDKDPLVKTSDKQWLLDRLDELHPGVRHSLLVHPTGDHCCTGQAAQVRADTAAFFDEALAAREVEPAGA
ncbi:hypothetical protein CR152_03830 [Massilia violaceinigra]|uniref:Peptidase S9 prolyl oligopeptidase catalytic domain-containing protein n=1 Tax=Massilia violaceinigra TaxID=2045208 RepID=A0A2D2DFI6_9BURK|nr:alpha/beta fold hydrolase [Massilia violaceinigra]ATQ73737.1 hypothetical protein CR152_03830 [Massilia violaceinigra]